MSEPASSPAETSVDPSVEVTIPDDLPILPTRGLVVFPYMIVPLFVGKDVSHGALDRAMATDKLIFLASQEESALEHRETNAPPPIGTIGVVMRTRQLADGQTKALVQGLMRGQLLRLQRDEEVLVGRVEKIHEIPMDEPTLEVEALARSLRDHIAKMGESGRSVSPDVILVLEKISDPGRLADLCAANLGLPTETAQRLLGILEPIARLRAVNEYVAHEAQLAAMQQQIESQAKEEMTRTQRDYYLRQQLRQIQQELGDGKSEEIRDLGERLAKASLPPAADEEAKRQLRRLEQMSFDSAESAVLRTYIEWIADLPWTRVVPESLDLKVARQILDTDHSDLLTVKERILDYLGVRKLKQDMKGPILCFVGPPGVGKTSLGRSIARSLGRPFVRVSLGGIRDEAEIRGHRRTYVGALPGRIIQAVKQAGARNPVLVLDEIDKIGGGGDFRGDPYAALLEVLDPEQNAQFRDHYLNLDFDLSKVLFIATANMLDPIPAPLRDRMEVIQLSGYTEEEKLRIAQAHIVPKQRAENGLRPEQLQFADVALRRIISEYTREAGLRNLERQIATICRKVARRVAEGEKPAATVAANDVPQFLGLPKFQGEAEMETDAVGEATGLAWTPVGGEILRVEASRMRGRQGLTLTGQLGEVMKESARAALTWTRAHASELGLTEDWFQTHEIHVHVPAGAIPKDGPSAGVTIAVAIASLVTGRPVRRDVAMTGEITLRGRVLPVGGIREKLLAAVRAGIGSVIVPQGNENDLQELPEVLRKKLQVKLVSQLDNAIEAALVPTARKRVKSRSQPRRR